MHPLIHELSKISNDELHEKMADISKKRMFAHRSGNSYLLQQLDLAMASYQSELAVRQQKELEELEKKSGTPNFKSIIDIQ